MSNLKLFNFILLKKLIKIKNKKMRKYDIENYNTIQPKPTYKSPIVRHKTLHQNIPQNIKSKNELIDNNNNIELISNKIEKSYTRAFPYNNNINNQTARENNRIILEQKEPKEIIKPKNKLRKNLSSYDILVPKNLKKITSSSNHFTFNDMKKKKRQSSVITLKSSINNKSYKDYDYMCTNCYNNKIVTKNFKEQQINPKEILNNTFTKVNPFYFQDKMKDIYKDKIQQKIKAVEKKQRQAQSNLAKYKIENPTLIEKFQKQQELSYNPMIAHEREDPRIDKALKKYDLKENFINKNKDLYQIDKPRKAINDYYENCLFQTPIIEDTYFVEPKYIKQISIDLREQIEEKKNDKKRKKEEEIKSEIISNKKMEDYNEFLFKKNKEQKNNYYSEFYKKTNYYENLRKIREENENKKNKKYIDNVKQKMRKEDEEKKAKYRQKKINGINKLQIWKKDFENEKNNKKKEKEKEAHKWYNYSQDYIAKCIHGNEVTKCSLCDRTYHKEQLLKYDRRSTDVSIVSSSAPSSQI